MNRPAREGRAAAALRVIAFGSAWFLAGAAPFVLLEDRLFVRYTYFRHAGVALAVGRFAALVAAQRPRRSGPPQAPRATVNS